MRRWIMAAAVVLAVVALIVALPPFFSHQKTLEGSTKMTAMGLVLLEDDAGLYVLGVIDGSRAGSAGILPGDRLTAARNTTLTTIAQLEDLLAVQDEMGPVPLTLSRRDQTVTVNLSLQ